MGVLLWVVVVLLLGRVDGVEVLAETSVSCHESQRCPRMGCPRTAGCAPGGRRGEISGAQKCDTLVTTRTCVYTNLYLDLETTTWVAFKTETRPGVNSMCDTVLRDHFSIAPNITSKNFARASEIKRFQTPVYLDQKYHALFGHWFTEEAFALFWAIAERQGTWHLDPSKARVFFFGHLIQRLNRDGSLFTRMRQRMWAQYDRLTGAFRGSQGTLFSAIAGGEPELGFTTLTSKPPTVKKPSPEEAAAAYSARGVEESGARTWMLHAAGNHVELSAPNFSGRYVVFDEVTVGGMMGRSPHTALTYFGNTPSLTEQSSMVSERPPNPADDEYDDPEKSVAHMHYMAHLARALGSPLEVDLRGGPAEAANQLLASSSGLNATATAAVMSRMARRGGTFSSTYKTLIVVLDREPEAYGRRFSNSEALHARLIEVFGPEKVYPRVLAAGSSPLTTNRAWIELLRKVTIVVSPHGSQLSNMGWMPPGGAIVEVQAPGCRDNGMYRTMADLWHHVYTSVLTPIPKNENEEPIEDDSPPVVQRRRRRLSHVERQLHASSTSSTARGGASAKKKRPSPASSSSKKSVSDSSVASLRSIASSQPTKEKPGERAPTPSEAFPQLPTRRRKRSGSSAFFSSRPALAQKQQQQRARAQGNGGGFRGNVGPARPWMNDQAIRNRQQQQLLLQQLRQPPVVAPRTIYREHNCYFNEATIQVDVEATVEAVRATDSDLASGTMQRLKLAAYEAMQLPPRGLDRWKPAIACSQLNADALLPKSIWATDTEAF